jgi:hypothetical protein
MNLNTNYGYHSLELCAESTVTVERRDGEPVLVIDGFAIYAPNTAAAYRLYEAAHEFAKSVAAWETQLVVETLQQSANDKAAVCAWQPCDSVDCCEFGPVDCPERALAGDPT